MSTIVRLVQGSAEWHEHRRNHRNATETPDRARACRRGDAVPAVADKLGLERSRKSPRRCCTAPSSSRRRARLRAADRARHASRWSWSTASTRPASTASPSAGDRMLGDQVPVKGRTRRSGKPRPARARALLVAGPAPAAGQPGRPGRTCTSSTAPRGSCSSSARSPSAGTRSTKAWDRFTELVTERAAATADRARHGIRDDAEWIAAAASTSRPRSWPTTRRTALDGRSSSSSASPSTAASRAAACR